MLWGLGSVPRVKGTYAVNPRLTFLLLVLRKSFCSFGGFRFVCKIRDDRCSGQETTGLNIATPLLCVLCWWVRRSKRDDTIILLSLTN